MHKDLVAEARKLEQMTPWVWLFEVWLNDTDALRVAQATESVTYPTTGGHLYYPYPLTHDGLVSTTEDESRTITIQAHNVDNQLRSLIHTHRGFVDKKVMITLVHKDHLDLTPEEGGTARQELWEISEPPEVARGTVTWQLGFVEQYERPTPHARFSRTQCSSRFGGPVCRFLHTKFSDADIINVGLLPYNVRVCDHGFDTKNGCKKHKDYAVALGLDDSLWPAVFRGQRRLRAPRN